MKGKNNWTLFLLILAGIVLGGFLGNLADGIQVRLALRNFMGSCDDCFDARILFWEV